MLTSQGDPPEKETRERDEETIASLHQSPHRIRRKFTDPGGDENSREGEANQAS